MRTPTFSKKQMGKVQASKVLIVALSWVQENKLGHRSQLYSTKGFSLQCNFNSQLSLGSYKLLHPCTQTQWTNWHVERSHLSISWVWRGTEPAYYTDTVEHSSTEKGSKGRLWQPSPAAGTGSWQNLEVAHAQIWLRVSEKWLKVIFLFPFFPYQVTHWVLHYHSKY